MPKSHRTCKKKIKGGAISARSSSQMSRRHGQRIGAERGEDPFHTTKGTFVAARDKVGVSTGFHPFTRFVA